MQSFAMNYFLASESRDNITLYDDLFRYIILDESSRQKELLTIMIIDSQDPFVS
jgi:hypothetical protein